jgi:hypothetical protein
MDDYTSAAGKAAKQFDAADSMLLVIVDAFDRVLRCT